MSAPFVCASCRATLRSFQHDTLVRGHVRPQSWLTSSTKDASRHFTSGPRCLAQRGGQALASKTKAEKQNQPPNDGANPPTAHMVRAVRQQLQNNPPRQAGPIEKFARFLRKRAGKSTETYIAYGACERLVKDCANQAPYNIPESQKKRNVELAKNKDGEDIGVGEGWWYDHIGLSPTFSSWAQVTFLHMYMLTCRIRMLPPDIAGTWHQHVINHFSYMAEDRMNVTHGIAASSHRSKYLKDLFLQWRGLTTAYDEGLAKGDAVLATAIWRNIFKAADDVDFRKVVEILEYMRHGLKALELTEHESLEAGAIIFNNPGSGKGPISVGRIMSRSTTDSEHDSSSS